MRLSTPAYLRIVRASALYDLLLTAPFATPSVRLGRYDGVTRWLFAAWMAWALAATGAPLLWLFVVPELAWGVLQWLPLARAHADGSGSSSARAAFTSAAPMRSSRGG